MSRRLRLLTAGALGMLIHFRSGHGDAAREVALYAEKAYATQWVSPARCCAAAQLPSQRPSSGSI